MQMNQQKNYYTITIMSVNGDDDSVSNPDSTDDISIGGDKGNGTW